MGEVVSKMWHWFLDALFPERCLLCGREGSFLCREHQHFPPAPGNQAFFDDLDRIFARTAYATPANEKIVEVFKFKGIRGLGKYMARAMIEAVPPDFFSEVVLIPIPLHWTRKIWRGFNQSEILAREISKLIPNVQISSGLRRIKRTHQQALLSKEERLRNMRGAFAWINHEPVPQKVLIIDDVVASGSTLDSAAAVLKDAGAQFVSALVFARGGKK